MKKGIIITGSIIILGAGAVLNAQDMNSSTTSTSSTSSTSSATTSSSQSPPLSLYRDQEFSVDIFAGGTLNENGFDHLSGEEIHHDGRVGLGGGGSFFFVRNLGIEGEVYTQNTDGHFIDETSGNLVLRAPIGESGLAPYIFGGGGHLFDPVSTTLGQGGAGLEMRFCPYVGVFVDGRWVFTDRIGNYGMGRAGLRVAF
jgi:hypothetical protein